MNSGFITSDIYKHRISLEKCLIDVFLCTFLFLPAFFNLLLLLVIVFLDFLKNRRIIIHINSTEILLFIYVWGCFFSSLYSKNVYLAFKEAITWLVFIIVIEIFIHNNVFEKVNYLSFMIGVLIMNIIFVIGKFFYSNLLDIIPTVNCFAVIDLIYVICIENIIQNMQAAPREIYRFLQFFLIIGIILSASRGIFALLVLYGVYCYIYKNRKKNPNNHEKTIIGVLLILFAYLAFNFMPIYLHNYVNELMTIFSGKVFSNKIRIVLYQKSIEYGLHHGLLLGAGAGNFSVVYPLFGIKGFVAVHSHNIILQPFIELGLIGFVVTIAMVMTLIFKAIKAKKNNDELYIEILIPFIIYGMVDYLWGDIRVGIMLFIFVGQMLKKVV